jgi:hypothetical protein
MVVRLELLIEETVVQVVMETVQQDLLVVQELLF